MTVNFLSIFKHLLPRAEAWKITIEKTLRDFFEGLTTVPEDIKEFFDAIWFELWPSTMSASNLKLWEEVHGLYPAPTVLTITERRNRIAAAWKALGGQSPYYLQNTFQNHGFDVYVHEWWEKPAASPPVAHNPNALLVGTLVECGEPGVECGEGFECGDFMTTVSNTGWLVNKLTHIGKNYTQLCGEPGVECGEPGVECGEFDGYTNTPYSWPLPQDESLYPYFIYIGDSTFGDRAQVPIERKDEFETLLLKYCPMEQWIGLFIEYVEPPPT